MSERLDVLEDVLQTLRLRGSMFFHSELAAPWGMSLTKVGSPRFHITLSGECFVGADKESAVKVQQGEIIMLPTGDSHWIADQPGRELVSSERAGEACELGNPMFKEGEITNCLMCGLIQFDQGTSHPILDSFPEMLHFPKLNATASIWTIVELIDAEVRKTGNRTGSIVDRLTEVLFLKLLNHYVNEHQEATGFFSALRDRRLHKALALIHSEPDYDWSLSSLGSRIGMSRATLVRHFQEEIGVSPMKYILDWRIMKAYNMIKYSNTPLEQIAESVGFASSRTLGKAFQRHYGYTPHDLRRGEIDTRMKDDRSFR